MKVGALASPPLAASGNVTLPGGGIPGTVSYDGTWVPDPASLQGPKQCPAPLQAFELLFVGREAGHHVARHSHLGEGEAQEEAAKSMVVVIE